MPLLPFAGSIEHTWVVFIGIAAISHAIWNFMAKRSENKTVFLWSLRLSSAILYLPLGIYFFPKQMISLQVWLFWGIGSIIIHSLYSTILGIAYEKSDFTLAYPIARGTGPLLAGFAGIAFLHEGAGVSTVLGAISISLGILVMYSGFHVDIAKQTIRSVIHSPWPILVGISIAGYTFFDKLAVQVIPPIPLDVLNNFGQAFILGGNVFKNHRLEVGIQWKKHGLSMVAAGALAGLAYILVLVTLTKIPVSEVSPVRESSIVIGALLGFFVLKEKFEFHKMIASLIIFLGVVLIII